MPINNRPTFLSDLNLNQIREGLQQTLFSTTLDLSQIRLLNDGFSSYVILVSDEFVLRIAKHAGAMAGHLKEQAILPFLQKHLPVQIPQPIWRTEPSHYFPYGAIAYRRILGIPFSLSLASHVNRNSVAQDLARFMVALHHVPLTEIIGLGFTATRDVESLQAEVRPALYAYLTKDEFQKMRMWWKRFLNSPVKDSFTPKLIHSDPWGENIILNETLSGVVGVIDFEAVDIGDVAQDFAAQKYLGPDFSSQVIEYYQELGGELENHFPSRLQAWSMLRELRGLQYAIRFPESGELADSIQKIRYEMSMSG